jgi:RND family efflux transporter MFP subunit
MTYRLIGLLALGAFVAGCSQSAPRPKRGARVERLLKVEVAHPVRKHIQRRLEVAATVEALRKVEVCARVPGVVKALDDSMEVGRKVKSGEVLLVLEVPELNAELAQKRAMLKQAEKMKRLARESWEVTVKEVEEGKKEDQKYRAEVDYHTSRVGRIAKLVRQNAQQEAVEEEARNQLEAARAALAANRARTAKREAKVQAAIAEHEVSQERIKVAEADRDRVEELVKLATIRAPFDAVITRRSVDPGAVIKDPGTVLFTVMQMDRVRVLIDVPQRDVPLLNSREQNPNPDGKGDPVALTMPALADAPSRGRFEGTVTRLTRALDPVTRTMRAEIEIPNPALELWPGMYGTASVLVEDRSDVLTVPASALVRRGEGLVEVYVVTNVAGEGPERRGVLRTRAVVLGLDDGKEVEIREGLKADDLVVARATGVIRPNDVVLAVEEGEAER